MRQKSFFDIPARDSPLTLQPSSCSHWHVLATVSDFSGFLRSSILLCSVAAAGLGKVTGGPLPSLPPPRKTRERVRKFFFFFPLRLCLSNFYPGGGGGEGSGEAEEARPLLDRIISRPVMLATYEIGVTSSLPSKLSAH